MERLNQMGRQGVVYFLHIEERAALMLFHVVVKGVMLQMHIGCPSITRNEAR